MTKIKREAIDDFLAAGPYAVVGASRDRSKFGNRVLRHYAARGRDVVGVHPTETEVEGIPCYPDLASIPTTPRAVSIVTPPFTTTRIVREALALGIRHIWMQPGAESETAVREAEEAGANVIHGGPCVMVEMR